MPKAITENTLFYGDNLYVLREYLQDESVDLVYLDPPFNAGRNFNVFFQDKSGKDSEAQIAAFEDTWEWGHTAEATYRELLTDIGGELGTLIAAMREFIGENALMAYLVMMAIRLTELHRVLKPTGSLYLHCDPTASHYLKLLLDTIFGVRNFQNEIYWLRKHGRTGPIKRFGTACDIIFFYTKSSKYTFHTIYRESNPDYIEKMFNNVDDTGRRYQIDNLASPNPRPNLMYDYKGYPHPPKGWAISKEKMEQWDREGKLHFPKSKEGRIRRKRYLDELKGEEVQSLWDDILPIGSQAAERLGWPTQKPIDLLDRIIQASSNPGDVVLDPFAGCGTSLVSAQGLNRKWIGIDITALATAMNKYRLADMFPDAKYNVVGLPIDLNGAQQLANDDRYQFQWWSLSLVKAKPQGGEVGSKTGKKGSDKGIDGIINFIDDASNKPKRVMVQVKSGHVKSGDIRDLRGVLDRENAAIGVFITLEEPSRDMTKEAISAGFYTSPFSQTTYPKVQILTITQLLSGLQVQMPAERGTFKSAGRVKEDDPDQLPLL